MKKLKVPTAIVVSHSLTYTGAPRVALDLANFLTRYYRVILINMNPDVSIAKQRVVPINIQRLDLPFWLHKPNFFFQILNKLVRICTKNNLNWRKIWFYLLLKLTTPNLIIFNTFYHIEIQSVANFLKIKNIRYLHENRGYLKDILPFEIGILNQGSKVIACSPSVVNDALSLGINCDEEYFPASTDRELLVIKEINKAWGLQQQNKKSILSVGSGWERKGGEFAEKFAFGNPEVLFHWIGEVENPDKFMSVIYHGQIKFVNYKIADSFFMLSREDPWPIAVLEALSHGLVVFGWSHLALIQELEKHGLAVAVEPFDIEKLNIAYKKFDFSSYYKNKSIANSFLDKFYSENLFERLIN